MAVRRTPKRKGILHSALSVPVPLISKGLSSPWNKQILTAVLALVQQAQQLRRWVHFPRQPGPALSRAFTKSCFVKGQNGAQCFFSLLLYPLMKIISYLN